MSDKTGISVPWSFRVIGAIGLIFNLLGCMNYISQMDAANVAAMPEVYRAIIESRPAWGTAAFAVAVFGGALGCFLLLVRNSVAIHVFVVALLGAILAQVPFLGMADFPVAGWIGWLSQVVVAAFLLWYSRQSVKKGWIS